MTPAGEWEPDAENWVRWARKPGHDAYWYYRDGFFDELVPCRLAGRSKSDAAKGVCVATSSLAVIARSGSIPPRGCSGPRRRPRREVRMSSPVEHRFHSPMPAFISCVAYNSLQVVDDLESTMDEIGRTLVHGGALCACVAHPVTDLGQSVRVEESRRVAVRADYFVSRRVDDPVEVDGMHMTFRGWTYNLEHYSKALERAGLHLVSIREPLPDGAVREARALAGRASVHVLPSGQTTDVEYRDGDSSQARH